MFKKLLMMSVVLAASSAFAFAQAAPYLGVSGGVTNTSGSRGLAGTVFAGYGSTIVSSTYLAGEVFANVGSASISDLSTYRTTYGYGASIIPGLLLNDRTMGYGRVGIVKSHFQGVDTNKTGGQFGLGLQTSLTPSLDLRGEYDYNTYRSGQKSDETKLGLVYKIN